MTNEALIALAGVGIGVLFTGIRVSKQYGRLEAVVELMRAQLDKMEARNTDHFKGIHDDLDRLNIDVGWIKGKINGD